MVNHKVKFYEKMKYQLSQSYLSTSLNVWNDKTQTNEPNVSFLKVKGLNNGVKIYIKGIHTENMIEEYLDDIDEKLYLMIEGLA